MKLISLPVRQFEAGKEKAKKELQESMEAEEAEKAAEEKIKMAREEYFMKITRIRY